MVSHDRQAGTPNGARSAAAEDGTRADSNKPSGPLTSYALFSKQVERASSRKSKDGSPTACLPYVANPASRAAVIYLVSSV